MLSKIHCQTCSLIEMYSRASSSSFISPLPIRTPFHASNQRRTGHGIHLSERPLKQNRRPHAPAIIAGVRQPSFNSGSKLRAAVLVSGGGRSLSNLCERIESNLLSNVSICVAIASKKSAGAIDIAKGYKLPVRVAIAKEYSGRADEYSCAITDILDEFNPDLVVMAGWMHFYRIPAHYTGKVINIHPSLIPSFCGKGYFGDRVHRAVVSDFCNSTQTSIF